MNRNIVQLPSYINGEKIFSENTILIKDVHGIESAEIHIVDEWKLQSAIENASIVQPQMATMAVSELIKISKACMANYYNQNSKFEFISKITGSPLEFSAESVEAVRRWGRDIDVFWEHVFSGYERGHLYRGSAPVVAVLPGNSEQSSLFVILQSLLSKNTVIVRPSCNGAGSFSAIEFVDAWNYTLDSFDYDSNHFLRSAITVVNIDSGHKFISNICVDGWNYIFFGSDSTILEIEKCIRDNCNPRRVIGYGTGLSTSICMSSAGDSCIQEIADSIVVNAGNECDSTDIVYIHDCIYDEFYNSLSDRISLINTQSESCNKSVGVILKENVDYIAGELGVRRGKYRFITDDFFKVESSFHAMIIPLNRYESTIEYPGPVAGVRKFGNMDELSVLIEKDLKDNNKTKSLATSVYASSQEEFQSVIPLLKAYTVKWNIPTHHMDINLPHQGVHLLRELTDVVYIQK